MSKSNILINKEYWYYKFIVTRIEQVEWTDNTVISDHGNVKVIITHFSKSCQISDMIHFVVSESRFVHVSSESYNQGFNQIENI